MTTTCLITACSNEGTGAITVQAPSTGFDGHGEHVRIPVCAEHLRLDGATITGVSLSEPPEMIPARMASIVVGDHISIQGEWHEVLEVRPACLVLANPKPWPEDRLFYETPLGGWTFVPRKRRAGE